MFCCWTTNKTQQQQQHIQINTGTKLKHVIIRGFAGCPFAWAETYNFDLIYCLKVIRINYFHRNIEPIFKFHKSQRVSPSNGVAQRNNNPNAVQIKTQIVRNRAPNYGIIRIIILICVGRIFSTKKRRVLQWFHFVNAHRIINRFQCNLLGVLLLFPEWNCFNDKNCMEYFFFLLFRIIYTNRSTFTRNQMACSCVDILIRLAYLKRNKNKIKINLLFKCFHLLSKLTWKMVSFFGEFFFCKYLFIPFCCEQCDCLQWLLAINSYHHIIYIELMFYMRLLFRASINDGSPHLPTSASSTWSIRVMRCAMFFNFWNRWNYQIGRHSFYRLPEAVTLITDHTIYGCALELRETRMQPQQQQPTQIPNENENAIEQFDVCSFHRQSTTTTKYDAFAFFILAHNPTANQQRKKKNVADTNKRLWTVNDFTHTKFQ